MTALADARLVLSTLRPIASIRRRLNRLRPSGTNPSPRVALIAVIGALVVGLAPHPLPAEADGTPSHPYSNPVWYPLRSSRLTDWVAKPVNGGPFSSLVACVRSNCGHKPNDPHGYWAIDFVGDRGDPVYAAGAGVFHIGARNEPCESGPAGTRQTWAWIDHGGGKVSRYHHLDDVVAREGELVTPADKIGEMGDSCGQSVNYLHFEVRTGGVYGVRVDPRQLRACVSGLGRVVLPGLLGFQSWDDLPYRRVGLPRTHSGCIPGVPRTPDRPRSTRVERGDGTATISWSNPSRPVNGVTVLTQIFRTSLDGYSRPTFVNLSPAARRVTLRGLLNGRRYRYRVLYRNAVGNGGYGPAVDVVPGAPPTRPTERRLVATDTRIGYAWYRSESNGRDVTGYQVAIRRRTAEGFTSWTADAVPPSRGTTYNWFARAPGATYQVRVRGLSSIGPSAWSPTSTITTQRN